MAFSSLTLSRCNSKDHLYPTAGISEAPEDSDGWHFIQDRCLQSPITSARKNRKRLVRGAGLGRLKKGELALEDHVRTWMEKKVVSGVPEGECRLPFLSNDPRMACFICNKRGHWRCIRCTIAAHSKCAPWPDNIIYPINQPRQAVCWKHPTDWRLEKKHAVATSDIEEVFCRLPLPYIDEEFKIDFIWKDIMENEMEPTPYIDIRRNVYLVKKQLDDADTNVGCTKCSTMSMCAEDCICRLQSMSCSKACYCSEMCTNRPFRKKKKVKVVKTQFCGWGAEAGESINKGDFVMEYIGEVIDDTLCKQRLWDMKCTGHQNFYMCSIRKDFTIDATFKGNACRFLNHSCNPNCNLEKWQVHGETRVGVFASQSIEAGEPLTYDYRFVHFGSKVECCCGSPNCQGYLGRKAKSDKMNLCWGSEHKRSAELVTPRK
ncbi:histone-lysine N-methyltransferase ASHR3-like isoform X2 [Magnolia sinica]|uniref:histone-lysine N-methyltransferase ASHR3-like isoform X2 n=1 Tax=Magnolia sinica TaxID=86752 RepID=UPI00265B4F2F|nr:histone-lysine N-methyltransferase ASHR3-like isoform X2 [Magnolia sinica]